MNRATLFACLLLVFSPYAMAQQDSGTAPNGQPPHAGREPPPEAYAACADKTAGASVTITLRNGRSVPAVCEQHGDRLAARPLQRPGPPAADGATPPPSN